VLRLPIRQESSFAWTWVDNRLICANHPSDRLAQYLLSNDLRVVAQGFVSEPLAQQVDAALLAARADGARSPIPEGGGDNREPSGSMSRVYAGSGMVTGRLNCGSALHPGAGAE
jgi:hypothetical protein